MISFETIRNQQRSCRQWRAWLPGLRGRRKSEEAIWLLNPLHAVWAQINGTQLVDSRMRPRGCMAPQPRAAEGSLASSPYLSPLDSLLPSSIGRRQTRSRFLFLQDRTTPLSAFWVWRCSRCLGITAIGSYCGELQSELWAPFSSLLL